MMLQLWMMADCPRCHSALKTLKEAGYEPEVLMMEDLRAGEIKDPEAMSHLIMTDGYAPMVKIGSRFMEQEEVDALASGELPLKLRYRGDAPADIWVNGHELSAEDHYKVLGMSPEEITYTYGVKDTADFIKRVREAIRYWDGVDA